MEPGAHPLDGAWAKMARAGQHVHLLHRLTEQFQRDKPVPLGVRISPDGDGIRIYLEPGAKPPIHLALVLGDIAHNLRSALDQTAWQLALLELGEEQLATDEVLGRRIAFPIQQDRARWERDRQRLVAVFGEGPVAAIEPLQPFNNEGKPLVNPLAMLQSINNTDKHRVRVTALAAIPLDGIQIAARRPIDLERARTLAAPDTIVEEGMDLFEIPLPDAPDHDVRVRLTEPPPVGFLIEEFGVLRLDRVPKLATDIADAIGHVSPFFSPIDDLQARFRALAVPEPH